MQYSAYDSSTAAEPGPPAHASAGDPAAPPAQPDTREQISQQEAQDRADAEAVFPLLRQVTPPEALASAEYVGFYFSAHWCPPCRKTTPLLAKSYKEVRDQSDHLFGQLCRRRQGCRVSCPFSRS